MVRVIRCRERNCPPVAGQSAAIAMVHGSSCSSHRPSSLKVHVNDRLTRCLGVIKVRTGVLGGPAGRGQCQRKVRCGVTDYAPMGSATTTPGMPQSFQGSRFTLHSAVVAELGTVNLSICHSVAENLYAECTIRRGHKTELHKLSICYVSGFQ